MWRSSTPISFRRPISCAAPCRRWSPIPAWPSCRRAGAMPTATLNWLTRAQGLLLDAHFAVEQEARFRAGLPMSFNGTAGVWRRAAIEHGGGWTGDTLTEDLDLSMRCVMKGWRTALMSRRGSAERTARNGGGLARAAGALDQGSRAMRAQAAARDLGKRTCRLWSKAAMSACRCASSHSTRWLSSAPRSA